MFTGLIEEVGIVRSLRKTTGESRITLECDRVLEGTAIGDSIAVNGVCLTVISLSSRAFVADVSSETWSRSNLEALKSGDTVNLERSLRVGGKMGGHFVQGHVDGVGTFLSGTPDGEFYTCLFSAPEDLSAFMVEKGSIAINGISLTIAALTDTTFSCAVVPHSWENTNLKRLKAGSPVNLEVDILAKYVRNLLQKSGLIPEKGETKASKLDRNFLAEHGFL